MTSATATCPIWSRCSSVLPWWRRSRRSHSSCRVGFWGIGDRFVAARGSLLAARGSLLAAGGWQATAEAETTRPDPRVWDLASLILSSRRAASREQRAANSRQYAPTLYVIVRPG